MVDSQRRGKPKLSSKSLNTPNNRPTFDQFGKNLLLSIIRRTGRVETEREVRSTVKRLDLYFAPNAGAVEALRPAGLLAVIAHEPALIELFHRAPSEMQVLECMAKQLGDYLQEMRFAVAERMRQRRLKSQTEPKSSAARSSTLRVSTLPRPPTLWIISATNPSKAMRRFAAAPLPLNPPRAGFYQIRNALQTHLIVVDELDQTDDTLMLRLLGADETLGRALEDLRKFSAKSWEAEVAGPWVMDLKLTSATAGSPLTKGHQKLMKEIEKTVLYFSDIRKQDRVEGRKEGHQEGTHDVLMRLAARRIGREFSKAEQSRVIVRVKKRGIEALEAAVIAPDVSVIERWIAVPKKATARPVTKAATKTPKRSAKRSAPSKTAKR